MEPVEWVLSIRDAAVQFYELGSDPFKVKYARNNPDVKARGPYKQDHFDAQAATRKRKRKEVYKDFREDAVYVILAYAIPAVLAAVTHESYRNFSEAATLTKGIAAALIGVNLLNDVPKMLIWAHRSGVHGKDAERARRAEPGPTMASRLGAAWQARQGRRP